MARRQVYVTPYESETGLTGIQLDRAFNALMRDWGREVKGWAAGYHGSGGWIYTELGCGKPVQQGWWNVWTTHHQAVINWLAKQLIGQTMDELADLAKGTYRPTLLVRGNQKERYRWALLANEFDRLMEVKGDARRAWRGSAHPQLHK